MTGRTREILSRFPAHFEAARPGKMLGAVVDALAKDLDVFAARLAAVRRAHRLGEAEEITDLLRIAALHGITPGELELLFMRFARVEALSAALLEADDDAARDAAAEALATIWSIATTHPVLPLYAPADDPANLDAARVRLLEAVSDASRYATLAGALRTRIAHICRLHTRGNGTVETMLAGAANALDLDIGTIVHGDDRFWHAAPVFDRLRLTRPVQENAERFEVEQEIIGLEENPIERVTTGSIGRMHAGVWSITRRGFGRVVMEIRITGAENDRTIGPMLVNCDEGRGIGYAGKVPPGKVLTFTEDGRALLDGADVTSSAYAWEGACFSAGGDAFVFDGPARDPRLRPAKFVTTTPAGALDRQAVYPHGDITLPAPAIDVGETRFAYFVQQAHVSASRTHLVTPRTRIAFFDASVFAPGDVNTAGEVAFTWEEHRPFSVRLLIPRRFAGLDAGDPEATEVRRRVGIAVERFRPTGVEVTVELIDDRWVVGRSTVGAGETNDLIDKLRAALVLWESPAETESP